jgi:hypothetical protein
MMLPTGNLHLDLNDFLDLNVLGPAALVLRSLSAARDGTTATLATAVPDFLLTPSQWAWVHGQGWDAAPG